jgi:hypothetical protein
MELAPAPPQLQIVMKSDQGPVTMREHSPLQAGALDTPEISVPQSLSRRRLDQSVPTMIRECIPVMLCAV